MRTIEYRVRWRRGPAEQGWKVRLFQERYAAQRFARFLTRPNPTYRVFGDEFGPSIDEPIVPVLELVIQHRAVGPWENDGEPV